MIMTRKQRILFLFLTLFLLLSLSSTAWAKTVLVSSPHYSNYGIGDSGWSNFTTALNSATGNSVSFTSDFGNLSEMLLYDAIFLQARETNSTLSIAERNNITAFAATGKKVLMIGENDNWLNWNQQITAIGGGSYNYMGYYLYETAAKVVDNALTAGADNVYLPAAGVAIGGTSLYNYNFATLWGSNQNILTILDVNLESNQYWSSDSNAAFTTNVAYWLADSKPVPIPPAFLLLGSGLVGLLGLRRKFGK
jgi:hypothetical protein